MRRAVEPWFLSFTLLSFTTGGIVPILVPLYLSQHDASAVDVGIVASALGTGMLTAPLWGSMVGRYNCHRLLASGGCLAVCAAIFGIPNVGDIAGWCALAFLLGCGMAAAFTISNLLILGNHPEPEVDARIGWLQTFITLGNMGGLAAAGLMSQLPLQSGLQLGAAASGCAALLGAATMRSPARNTGLKRLHGAFIAFPYRPAPARLAAASEPLAASSHRGKPRARRPSLLPMDASAVPPPASGSLWALIALWTVANLGLNGIHAFYPLIMRVEYTVQPLAASFALLVATAIAAALAAPAGRMTNRRGGRQVLTLGLILYAVALLGLIGLSVAALALRPAGLVFTAAFTVVSPLLAVSSTILAAELSSDKGRALGLYNGGFALALLAGPIIGGHLADGPGGYRSVILFALAGVLTALLLTRLLPGKERPRSSPIKA